MHDELVSIMSSPAFRRPYLAGVAAVLALACSSSSSVHPAADGAGLQPDGGPTVVDAPITQPDVRPDDGPAPGPDATMDAHQITSCPPAGSGGGFSGFPCCYFWSAVPSDAGPPGACNVGSCVEGSTPDGGPPLGVICPDGYFSAVVCPSPLGGCGGAPTCCKITP